ncbi:MAG TPA: hypothetical protein VJT31_25855, partial [Rugosimonospora sp.]|nr:hypothetical protein [Rugosimonospora sp.]
AGRADTEAPTQHQFAEAAAALLAGLAAAEGGALLHLDDGQWCDEVTRSVLHRLGPGLPGSRLLVVLTTRDAAAPWPAATEVPLRVLDAAAVAELAGLQLGSAAAPPDLVDQLTARSGGNPLAVVEYVRAIVDAGLLSPSWGAWRLDRAGLDALALPDDVMDLLARRVDGLRPQARQMLAVAAIAGGRFTAALLEATVAPAATAATASGSTDVAAVLADAVTAQLIEPVPGGYAFLHERIRDALLDTLDDADRRRLHQRVAEHLDAVAEPGTADVYAVARHYLCGETDHDRHRVYRAVRAAGSFALSQCATADAVELLGQAADIAASAGIVPDTGFHIELGVAASRTGRFGLADEHLTVALDLEREPRRRARIYGYLAESRHLRGEGDQMADLANRGLAEVGYPVPRNPLLLALSTVLLFLLGLAVAKLPRRLRTVTGVRRERYLLRASLSYTGAHGAAMAIRMPLVGAYALRSLYLVNRLGPGAEYAEVVASLGTLANVIGLHRVTAWALERATAAAAGTSDAATIARTEWIKGIAYDGAPPMGMDTGRSMRRALDRHGQAMTAADFLTGAALLGDLGLFRGDLADVGEWLRRSAVRAPEPSEVLGNPFAVIHPQAAALAGRPAEAAAGLAKVEEFLRGAPNNRGQQINVAIAAVHIAVEQGEVGAVFDEAVARFEALHLKPAQILSTQRKAWMHIAFGRLAQATDGAAHGGPAPAGAADRLRTA